MARPSGRAELMMRSYSRFGLCGMVVGSISIGSTKPWRSSIVVGSHVRSVLVVITVSGCVSVMKSRLQSKPLPLARRSVMRPSGFWHGSMIDDGFLQDALGLGSRS